MANRVLHMGLGILAWCGASRALDAQPAERDRDRMPRSAERWLNGLGVDSRRAIDFRATVLVDSVYVNEQVTWQAAVLINPRIRDRLRRNPEFVPPALQGVLAYDLGAPQQMTALATDGTAFNGYLFRRAMFPVTAGTLRIPAPQLNYRLPPNRGYSSREESYVVQAESTTVVVRPLPFEGRPADFAGAVGRYAISAALESTDVGVGEPLLLTIRVRGTGNVALLTRPSVVIRWGAVVAGAERVAIDTSSNVVRGMKEFEFVITPRDTGMVTVPAVSFAFFDPVRAAYTVATSLPQPVHVRAIAAGMSVESREMAVGARDEPMSVQDDVGLRAWDGVDSATGGLTWHPMWSWLWWGLFPCLAFVRLAHQQRRAARTMVRDEDARFVDDDHSPAGDARRLRRHLLHRLAQRLDVAPSSLADHDAVRRALRLAGVSREAAQDVADLLERLAAAGFGQPGDRPIARVGAAMVEAMLQRVDAEAIAMATGQPRKRWIPRLVLIIGALSLVEIPPLAAAQVAAAPMVTAPPRGSSERDPIYTLVEQASLAHGQQDYRRAGQLWAQAVRQHPHDVALLVNWGESAWRGGDTVSAVVAWHRAQRESPTDRDVRERIGALPPGAREGWTMVPPVRSEVVLGIGGLLWAIGWLLVSRRLPHRRFGAVITIILGSAAGLAGSWLASARRLDSLAVVSSPMMLREAPARDAGAVGGIGTGDMVRLRATQDAWHQVELADGRVGWIPTIPALALLVDRKDR